MAHFLYRPHIIEGDRVVTTDYLIRHCHLVPGPRQNPQLGLPVDLLCCAVEMDIRPSETISAPVIFTFAGDSSRYAAPALALLDAGIYACDAGLAWRSARISISRFALQLRSDVALVLKVEGSSAMKIDAVQATRATAHRAAIYCCPELRRQNTPERLHLQLSGTDCADYRIALTSLNDGGDQ